MGGGVWTQDYLNVTSITSSACVKNFRFGVFTSTLWIIGVNWGKLEEKYVSLMINRWQQSKRTSWLLKNNRKPQKGLPPAGNEVI